VPFFWIICVLKFFFRKWSELQSAILLFFSVKNGTHNCVIQTYGCLIIRRWSKVQSAILLFFSVKNGTRNCVIQTYGCLIIRKWSFQKKKKMAHVNFFFVSGNSAFSIIMHVFYLSNFTQNSFQGFHLFSIYFFSHFSG